MALRTQYNQLEKDMLTKMEQAVIHADYLRIIDKSRAVKKRIEAMER